MAEHAQRFGGPWSLLKVGVVEKYLQAFNSALRQKPTPAKPFTRTYIDTFAGSGDFTFAGEVPLLDEDEAQHIHQGSVKRALAVKPPFDDLYFIEKNRKNAASLRKAVGDDARAHVIEGDANVEAIALLQRLNWRRRRGVIFVDPYGQECGWDIVRAIAKTKSLDMWWLYPISAVYRNAPRDRAALTPEKDALVTRCLDDLEWQDKLYHSTANPGQGEMFDGMEAAHDRIPPNQIEALVTTKLRELFPHVEPPAKLRLRGDSGLNCSVCILRCRMMRPRRSPRQAL
jgi:three-Cys-motif partner protein